MHELTVIIPTFNEKENIEGIIREIDKVLKDAKIDFEILVVDDSSKDGTIQTVQSIAATLKNVRIHVRYRDPGLSQSVVDGFRLSTAPIKAVIDADFSHPTSLLPVFYNEIKDGADIVIGSRYMPGGGIKNWPTSRYIISKGATFIARAIFPQVTDPVSGFFAVKKEVVDKASLRPKGYKILLEILGKGKYQKVVEIPYIFTNRKAGGSKLKTSTIIDYIRQVVDIIRYRI